MTLPIPSDLSLWLNTATAGLPGSISRTARAEFEAHYFDAVAEYEAQGQTTDQAHCSALADLGDPQTAGEALRQTHLARRHYLCATLLSMIWPLYPFIFLFFGWLLPSALNAILYYSGLVFFVFYPFYTLRLLLLNRLNPDVLKQPLTLINGSVPTYFGPLLFIELFFGYNVTPHTILGSTVPPLVNIFGVITISGGVVTGLAAVWIAYALIRLDDPLASLRLPVAFTLGLTGLSMSSFNLALALGFNFLADLINVGFFISSFVFYALLALLFFRAAWRRIETPRRLA